MKRRHNILLLVACCVLSVVGVQFALAQWVQVGSGMGQIWNIQINPTNQQIMYAASNTLGIYKSTDGGNTWAPSISGLLNLTVQAMAISGSNPNILFCGTTQTGASNGVYKSTDAGATWTLSNTGITEASIAISAIAIDPTNPNTVYITIFDGVTNATTGIWKTTDGGANWFASSTGTERNKNFLSFAINPLNPNTIYVGSSFISSDTLQCRIYKSTNAGAVWFDVSSGLPATKGTTTHDPVRALSIQPADTNKVLAGVFLNEANGGAYLTTNGGGIWTRIQNGLPTTVGTLPRSVLIKPGSTSEFFVGLGRTGDTDVGVYRTTDAGATWVSFVSGALTNTTTVRWLAYNATAAQLFAGGANATVATYQGVFRYQFPLPPPPVVNRALLLPTPGVNTNYVQIPHQASMVGFGNNITIEAWVKLGGSTTPNTVLNHGAASFDYQLGITSANMFPFFRAGGVVVTDSFANLTVGAWAHLAVTYDGTTAKFYKDGTLHLSRAAVLTLGSSTNEMRIGRGNNDPGSGDLDEVRFWSVVRTQGQIDSTKCLKYPAQFASTAGLKAVWHFDSTYVDSVSGYNGTPLGTVGFETATLPCGPVGVAESNPDVPSDYQLAQNYPNPFNPTTTIQYGLPAAANVMLKIYNVLGQEVITLIDEQKNPGTFQTIWNGRNSAGVQVASGVYFYSLVARSTNNATTYTNIKKMLFLK